MSSLPLFDQQPPSRFAPPEDITSGRHRGSETSEQAHEIAKISKEAAYALIVRTLRARGGKGETVEGLSRALGIRYSTVSARVSELRYKKGLVVPSGERRPTTSGCPAAVLVLAELVAVSR